MDIPAKFTINLYAKIFHWSSFIKLFPVQFYFKIEVYAFSFWTEYKRVCFFDI